MSFIFKNETMHISKSMRKFIREEKARIRREVLDLKEQKRLIGEIYQNLLKKPEIKAKKETKEKKKTEVKAKAEVKVKNKSKETKKAK